MALKLFHTGTRRKEEFRSLKSRQVSIYVCGITPYDTTHLGHAFTYVSYDALVRYLAYKGFKVNYTQNVTDIDDDVLRKGREEGRDWKELGNFWTNRFLTDLKDLNLLAPTHYVKATDSIPRIIKIVEALMKKGFAYKSGNNVYFEVGMFPKYGELSHFNAKQMRYLLKERGGDPEDHLKRGALDFILWQGWKEGEPFWDAPFGKGRPGWHIECSAMINQYLGERIDIHGGGRDLVFPHHESEIAQSESYTGKRPFARNFVHTAMVVYMGEKMAKSLGNLILVSDLLKKYSPNAVRWMLLSHHYRDIWEYEPKEMDTAESHLRIITKALRHSGKAKADRHVIARFEAMMDDDLDIPAVLRFVDMLLKDGNPSSARYILDVLGFSV